MTKKGSNKAADVSTRPKTPAELEAEREAAELERNVAEPRRIFEFPDIADVMPDLCRRYREIVTQASALEKERKELSPLILPLLDTTGERVIADDDWIAIKARGSRTVLSETKLLEAGVDAEVIEQCRVTIKYDYLQVRDPNKANRRGMAERLTETEE